MLHSRYDFKEGSGQNTVNQKKLSTELNFPIFLGLVFSARQRLNTHNLTEQKSRSLMNGFLEICSSSWARTKD
jgi:hypothetical protein